MKTKMQIIQQLLDDRKVTAEEAMILMEKEKEYVYYPYDRYVYPPYQQWPYPYIAPTFQTYSTTGELTVNSN